MTTPDVRTRPREAQPMRRIVGALLLIVAPALAIGTRAITDRDRTVKGRIPQPITAVDSEAYNSLIFHGAHAQARHDARWSITGYATLGLVGTLVGIGLLVWAAQTQRRLPTAEPR